MFGLFELDQELLARARFGRGYRNKQLETKRRSAILWLRYKSSVGWWMDSVAKPLDRRQD